MPFPLVCSGLRPCRPPVFKMSGFTYKAELVRHDKMGMGSFELNP